MQHFRYTAVDRKGEQVSAAELADSEAELIRRLRGKGLSPITIELDSSGIRATASSGVRSSDLVDILRGLGTLLTSHVPVDRALGLLAQTSDREAVVQGGRGPLFADRTGRPDAHQGAQVEVTLGVGAVEEQVVGGGEVGHVGSVGRTPGPGPGRKVSLSVLG